MQNWEYMVVPLAEAGKLKKRSSGFGPERLNELGGEGWEAVGTTLKRGEAACGFMTARRALGVAVAAILVVVGLRALCARFGGSACGRCGQGRCCCGAPAEPNAES